MSNDLNKKIQQISELLGQEEMPDTVKDLLSVLAKSMSSGDQDEENHRQQSENIDNDKDDIDIIDDIDTDDIETAGKVEVSQEKPEAAEHQHRGFSDETRPNYGPSSSLGNNDLAGKLKYAVNSISNMNDPRINLLIAIKPFLNSSRQRKINNCVQLLQMTSITRLLSEQDK
jgi:N-acetylmuramoyl-L-alanine amidase